MLPIVRWHLVGLAVIAALFVVVVPKLTKPVEVETTPVVSGPNGAPLIPMRALFRSGNGWSTYIFTHRLAYEMPIEIKQISDSTAEITSGLRTGVDVILSPSGRIKHKTPVSVRRSPS